MEELTWSDGIKYEKSKKMTPEQKEAYMSEIEARKHNIQQQQDAYQLSLGEIENINRKESLTFSFKDTKRDHVNEQIGMRQMTEQTNMNPFRSNNNYISDIDAQENFLRPRNSENMEFKNKE